MKIVVIGGSGLIGSAVVTRLREHGHEAVPASPSTGVNTLTGQGLADALSGASVVIDVSNSPSSDDEAALRFFAMSTRNLLAAETVAGVRHHVVLSVVGADRLPDSGYFRAKLAQEELITSSSVPYSIVRATQFFEFVIRIADAASDGDTVRLAPVLFQPIAADDVAAAVGRISVGPPLNGIVEIAGPERSRFADWLSRSTARTRGGTMPTDERDLKREIADELTLAESSRPDEAMRDPVADWRFDPTEAQRYEVVLHSLLGAVEVLDDDRSQRDRPGKESDSWI